MALFDIAPVEGLESQLGLLVAALQDGTREWQENLEHPEPDAVWWQIRENGPSIGGSILHIAACEAYWLGEFVATLPADESSPATIYDQSLDQYIPHWPAPPREPIEWYFEILKRQRETSIEWIRAHGNPTARYERRDGDVTYRWIVAHLVQHDSYHGGQAVMLHESWKLRQS